MSKKKNTIKKQIIAAALMATVPFATVSAYEPAPIEQGSILDKIKSSVSKRTSAISVETDLEIGLTATDFGSLSESSNYIPEVAAGARVKFGNLATLVVSGIQERNLDELGDTDFDQDYIDSVIKDLHLAFSLGFLDLKVGNMAAIGNVGVVSNDARRRDAISDQTRQEFESVTGVSVSLNKFINIPTSDQAALKEVVGVVNQALAHTTVTIFDNNSGLLGVDDIDSYAVETFVTLKGFTLSGATIQAENEAGDDKRYIVGATKTIAGVDAYGKYEDINNDASDVESRAILGLGKGLSSDMALVPSLLDGTYIAAEYQVEDRGANNVDIYAVSARKTMKSGWTVSGQVSYSDAEDDLIQNTNEDVTVKAKAAFKF